jgi:polysaccharide biosynthesis/export protein
MTHKLLLFVLLTCAVCKGQSTWTLPDQPASTPANVCDTDTHPGEECDTDTTVTGMSPSASLARERARTSLRNPSTTATTAPAKHLPSAKIMMPPLVKSDFEEYAEDATGQQLPIFGRQMFEDVPTTFSPVERVPVPAQYVLGPGDELIVRVWGKIDFDAHVTVDRDGQIFVPKVGALTVAGLRFEQVESYLRAAIGNLYKDFELNVALGQLRSIQVFVLGSARRPGLYTISSLSTLVNALFASGGPSATGSMRRIELRRKGRLLADFDLYDLAQKGDESHDSPLLSGDVIFIPSIGPQVAITGSVNQPGIYELKAGTTVGAAVEGAGGLTSLAGSTRAVLERIDDHSTRQVEEFHLDANGLEETLKDGDLLRIFPISPKFENAVTLRGNVAQPGRYVWKHGMRISDLIPSRDSLLTRNYWMEHNRVPPETAAIAARRRQSNPEDRTERNAEDSTGSATTGSPESIPGREGTGRSQSDIDGDVNREGNEGGERANVTPKYSMVESIPANNTEINWDYAVIKRLDEHDLSTRLIAFHLGDAIDHPDSADNQALLPGDSVTVFSRADIALPVEKHATIITINGEVNAPGLYRVNPGETLRDVVRRAGGLTAHSYLYASRLTRISTQQQEEEQLRQSTEKMQSELTAKYANSAPQPGQSAADQQAQLGMQQAAIARLAAVAASGRVIMNMKPDASTLEDIPNLAVEDGDTFYIPPRMSTVQVAGAVYNANAFLQQPGRRLVAYLNDAGGPTRQADRKHIFVLRADGMVVTSQARESLWRSNSGFAQMRLLPGDAIIVPEKIATSSLMYNVNNWAQLASSGALAAAALSVAK